MTAVTIPNPMLAEGWRTHPATIGQPANRDDDDGPSGGLLRKIIERVTQQPSEEQA